jgi:hypothetical protein
VPDVELARRAFIEHGFLADDERDHARSVAATYRLVQLARHGLLARIRKSLCARTAGCALTTGGLCGCLGEACGHRPACKRNEERNAKSGVSRPHRCQSLHLRNGDAELNFG